MRRKASVLTVAILLLTANLQAIAFGQPDSTLISMTLKDAPIEKAFSVLKNQSSYRVMYSDEVLKNALPVTISVAKTPVRTVLDILFRGQPFSYQIVDKKIIITPLNKKISATGQKLVKDSIITGTVKDADGKPIQGVTVTVRGTNKTVVTDEKGTFSIPVMPGQVLVFSSVNLRTKEERIVSADLLQVLSITLLPKIANIDSVTIVSTGYQDIPKERATGSFVKIDNELLNRSVSTNILDRIYNVTSGLSYDPRNIAVPGKSEITIRGLSTIQGNVHPLIVVDGFPYDESTGLDIINNINPNDVLSITVLKDAAAASIWGVRAGNGVIVITTKSGKFNQKTQVQLNTNVTVGRKPNLGYLPIMSSSDIIDVEKQLFNNGYYNTYDDAYPYFDYFPSLPNVAEILLAVRRGQITATAADLQIADLSKKDVRNDINKYLLQESINQQYALNISGGNNKVSYYGSLGYDKNRENSVRDKYERFTFRLDNTYRVLNNLELNSYINYSQDKTYSNGLPFSAFIPNGTNQVAPYTQFEAANGTPSAIPYVYRSAYIDTINNSSLLDWNYRPLDELKYNDNTYNNFDTRFGISLKYTIIPGLNIEVKGQYQKILSDNIKYNSVESFYTRDLINQYMYYSPSTGQPVYPIPVGGILDKVDGNKTTWNIRGQINYNKKWNRNEVVAIIGTEESESNFNQYGNRWYGYNSSTNNFNTFIDYSTFYNLRAQAGGSNQIPSVNNYFVGSLDRIRSFYANGAYTYKNRYILSLSGRQDAANLFGVKANDKVAPLWSGGMAWNISNEDFYKIQWLQFLKLRGTYGYNGNIKADATTYPTMLYSGYNSRTSAIMGQIITPPNPSLRWERVNILNIGLDFETVKRKIGGTIEYYYKRGLDLISPVSIETTSGWQSYIGNNASVRGKGWDLTLNTRNIDAKFKWYTDLLFSYNIDKVTSYQAAPTVNSLLGLSSPNIGKPLNSIYSYSWAGLDPNNGDPRGYIVDTIVTYSNAVANSQPKDLVYHGPANPTVFGSLRNTFSFGNFSFSFNITYKLGYYFRRTSINYTNLLNGGWGGHGDYAHRWQKPSDENNTYVPSMPNLSNIDPNRDAFYAFSSVLVEKGDHIRLQDIRISYTLNKKSIKTIPFQDIQLFIYANNIGILWRANKEGIDPDYSNSSIPNPRTISCGLSINF